MRPLRPFRRLRPLRRMMILTEGKLGVFSSKTAASLIRYCPHEVACVLDSHAPRTGQPLESFLGIGRGIPIVKSVRDGLRYQHTQLLIGIAPVGGKLPAAWRKTILEAISAKLDIVSGLHQVLNDDAEFVRAAKKSRVRIWDVRVPP